MQQNSASVHPDSIKESNTNKNGKMNFLKAFWIGLKSNQYGNLKKEYSSHIYVIKSE